MIILIRLFSYLIGPFIMRIVKKDGMDKKSRILFAIINAIIISAIWAMLSSYNIYAILGAIAGGTITGTLLGLIILPAAKQTGSTDTEQQEADDATSVENMNSDLTASDDINYSEPGTEMTSAEEVSEEDLHEDDPVDIIQSEKGTPGVSLIPEKELRLLKELHDSGVLSDSEFKEKKKQLLKI